MGEYLIRTMSRSELDFAVELAAREGWNPGLHDAECFYHTDPEGFLIGLLDGRPIGCISAVSYNGRFGFVGFYIVLPEYRGRGYGVALWNRAMGRLAGHNIGLDGVLAQQPNYIKSGFRLAYRNIRFEGSARWSPQGEAPLVDLRSIDLEALATYDRALFPEERSEFLQCWRSAPGATGQGYLEEGQIRGYGLIRPCRTGHKIGPLFADSPEVAEAIYQALVASVKEGDAVYLDVPEVNGAAVGLAERHGMRRVFETARMYTGEAPAIALHRLFGVTSFELG